MKKVLLAITLAVAAGQVFATDKSGNELIDEIKAFDRLRAKNNPDYLVQHVDAVKLGYGIGFVSGIARTLNDTSRVCIPSAAL